jgi:hypothetical protein
MIRKHQLNKTLPHMGKIVQKLLMEMKKDRNQLSKLTGWGRNSIDKLLLKKIWSGLEMLVVGNALQVKLTDYLYPEEEPKFPKSMFDAEVEARLKAERTAADQQYRADMLQKEVEVLKYAIEHGKK